MEEILRVLYSIMPADITLERTQGWKWTLTMLTEWEGTQYVQWVHNFERGAMLAWSRGPVQQDSGKKARWIVWSHIQAVLQSL